jgi:hypothetical protein
VLGLLFCMAGVRALAVFGSASIPRLHEVGLSGEVLLFTLAVTALSGILIGVVPAWRLSRSDQQGILAQGPRGSSVGRGWSRHNRIGRLLVATQLALSLVLLVGAGLLVRSFTRVLRVPLGFKTYRRLWERLGSLTGVTAAGGVSALPLSQMMAWGPITVEGRTPAPGEAFINADIRVVGGDYFRTMEMTSCSPNNSGPDRTRSASVCARAGSTPPARRGSPWSAWWGGSSKTAWTRSPASRCTIRTPNSRPGP